MFKFVKKVFFLGLTILSDLTNANSLLNCISLKNQKCKGRPKNINVNSNEPVFLILEQVNIVVVVIMLIIHMQKYVFLML